MRRTAEPEATLDVTSSSSPPRNTPTSCHGTTNNSSASSALFDGKPHENLCNNAFAVQLKKPHYSISALATKILNGDSDDYPDEGCVLPQGRGCEVSDEDLQQQKCINGKLVPLLMLM
jgi:protein SMG6